MGRSVEHAERRGGKKQKLPRGAVALLRRRSKTLKRKYSHKFATHRFLLDNFEQMALNNCPYLFAATLRKELHHFRGELERSQSTKIHTMLSQQFWEIVSDANTSSNLVSVGWRQLSSRRTPPCGCQPKTRCTAKIANISLLGSSVYSATRFFCIPKQMEDLSDEEYDSDEEEIAPRYVNIHFQSPRCRLTESN